MKPLRNKGNNYREYTLEDVGTLNRIKFLRMLGISVQDIRRVQKREISLPVLMEQRERELAEERARLEEICRHCERDRLLTLFLQALGFTFLCTALLFRLWIGQRIPLWTTFAGFGLAGVLLIEKWRIRKKMEKGTRL